MILGAKINFYKHEERAEEEKEVGVSVTWYISDFLMEEDIGESNALISS